MKIIGLDIETTGIDVENGSVLELGVVGYDSEQHSSLESIVKNTPKLTILIYHQNLKNANIEALALNKDLIDEINKYANKIGNSYIENRSFMDFLNYDQDENHELWLVDNDKVAFVFMYWLVKNNFVEYTNYFKNNVNQEEFINTFDSMIKSKNIDPNFINSLKYYIRGITIAGKNVATFDIPYLKNNVPYFKDIIKIKHRMIDPSITFTVSSDPEVPNLYNCMERIGIKSQTAHRAVYDVLDILYLIYFHFKKSKYRTYLALKKQDNSIDIVDKLVIDSTSENDKQKIKEFKDKYNDCYVLNELELHKFAVTGRLNTFKHELNNLNIKDPLFVDKDVHVIHYQKDSENLNKLKQSIKSGKYVVEYHKVFSMQQDTIQVIKQGNKIMIYHNLDFNKLKELLEI